MADLRKVFEGIMHDWGTNVYLQRRIYDNGEGIYSLPPPQAKDSYFSKNLEKFTVRYVFAGRKTALTNVAEERPEGIVHTVNRVWYFPHFANPREGDRLYQADPRYVNKMETYLIDYAQPFRGWHGEIAYWETGGTRENPN